MLARVIATGMPVAFEAGDQRRFEVLCLKGPLCCPGTAPWQCEMSSVLVYTACINLISTQFQKAGKRFQARPT